MGEAKNIIIIEIQTVCSSGRRPASCKKVNTKIKKVVAPKIRAKKAFKEKNRTVNRVSRRQVNWKLNNTYEGKIVRLEIMSDNYVDLKKICCSFVVA